MKTCPNCKQTVSDTAKFCGKCGFNIKKYEEENIASERFCTECGAKMPANMSFCTECGTNLDDIGSSVSGSSNGFGSSLNFDFSSLQSEAEDQLAKQKMLEDFEIEDGVLKKYKGKGGKVVIPKEVVLVGPNAFEWNRNVEEISFEDDDTDVGPEAFARCYFKKIILPSKLKIIKKAVFCQCFDLSEIIFNSDIIEIEEEAFAACTSMTNINLPETVQKINKRAFASSGLITFTFPRDCVLVGEGAFWGSGLVSITIPKRIKWMNKEGWSRPSGVFEGCENLQDVNIEHGVDTLPECIFYACKGLRSITIPDSILSIGQFAFAYCTSISRITLPQHISSIEEYLFHGCTALKEFNLPRDLTTIFLSSFEGCSAVERIRYEAIATSISYKEGTFGGIGLPLKDIGSQGGGITVTVGREAKAIPARLFERCCKLNSVIFESGSACEIIGENAFWCCESLNSIQLPNSITRIEKMAFASCESLPGFDIPSSVNYIGPSAFSNCKKITNIVIPKKVTKIESGSFSHCYNLVNIQLHNDLIEIGERAFSACHALPNIEIPNSVVSIGEGAFALCNRLKTIYIPPRFKSHFYQYDFNWWDIRVIEI